MYDLLSKEMRDAIVFSKAPSPQDPGARYKGFAPGTTTYKAGTIVREGCKPLDCDIIYDRDVAIKMRDGITIYVDIYRPNTTEKLPALLNSSMFGKNGSYLTLDDFPNRADVPLSWVSGLDGWESTDPGFWCPNQYAVVYMDIRGVRSSEGDIPYFGSQDASDNYDTIEALAQMDWCSGKVAMAGNSWLGITQWYAAAMNPPHLVAIAPWEGHGNMYDDEYMRGGIPNIPSARPNVSYGNNNCEDLRAMMEKFPFMNEYWDDKYAKFEKVTVPAYVTASYTSTLHTHGTFEGYRRISSQEKWLRVHNTQEWIDQYNINYELDLLKFMDCYLKGKENGWKDTPKVRISVLDPGHKDIIDRPETSFPLERQVLHSLYLNADSGTLTAQKPTAETTVTFATDDYKPVMEFDGLENHGMMDDVTAGRAAFTIQFNKQTEIVGYPKVKLWVSADKSKDLDLFVRIAKKDADGNYLFHNAILYKFTGPNGILRTSLRALDPEKSTPSEPFHPYTEESYAPLSPGEIVPVEIGIWPIGELFHAGEQLELSVAGFDFMGQAPHHGIPLCYNEGNCTIYTGGAYDSHLYLPIIEN